MNEFVLFSIQHRAFQSQGGNYNSDWRKSARFTVSEAITRCKAQVDHEGNVALVPVSVEVLQEIARKDND